MSKSPSHIPLIASRINLVNKILDASMKMENQSGPLLLVFWGSRGSGKTTFLEGAKHALSSNTGIGVAGFWDLSTGKPGNLPGEILKAVGNKKNKYKAIFFDNMDVLLRDSSGREFFDFESNLILPLIERGDTIIAAASRVELSQWQEYDVRLRQENHQLHPLTLDEIEDLVKGRKVDADTVYHLTLGHPKALEKYLSHPKWDAQEVARFASKYFTEELPGKTRKMAQTASLLPTFNVYLLRKVHGDTNSDEDGLLSHYNEQINELTRRWIIRFDADNGAYRFTDSAVRRLLAVDYAADHQKEFNHIQRIAAEYFQEEAKSATFLPQLIVSAIYHQAQISRGKTPGSRGAHCIKWVESMRNYWNGANWKLVIEKWENMVGNMGLKHELLSLIGEKHHQQISGKFSEYKMEMEA